MKKTQPVTFAFGTILGLILSIVSIAQQPADTTAKKDSVVMLSQVVVKSQKSFIEQSAGKLTLNVSASPVAAGGNAYEVLLKAPGMLEQQDLLQYKGKAINVRIDGRPSNLSGEELKAMLSSLPAGTIEKIEIISNPSANYDAQGGTVVNIKMAKNKNFGTNGTATAGVTAGKYGRYSAGGTINHRSRNMNAYGGYDLSIGNQFSRGTSDRPLTNNLSILESGYAKHFRESHVYRAGVDFDFNKTTTAGILFKGMNVVRKRDTENNTWSMDGIVIDSSSTVFNKGKTSISNPSLNIYFKTQPGKGQELVINADYFSYQKKWNDDFVTLYRDDKGSAFRPDYLLNNGSKADITVMSVSADFSKTVKAGRWDAGLKSTFNKTDNNTSWYFLEGNDWQIDAGKSDHFIYNEDIHAAYVKYAVTTGKLNLEAGLRSELTVTQGHSLTINRKDNRAYLDFFPSAAINYNASETHQIGLSYCRSISRFGFDVVNPFVTYISQYRYAQGNPDVKPNYSNNFELSHTYKNKVFSSVGYGHFRNVLAPVFKKDQVSEAVISTTENLQSADQLEASITYVEAIRGGKWTITNSAGMLHAVIHDKAGAGTGSRTTGAFVSSSHMFRLKKGWAAELSGNYISSLTIGVLKLRPQGGVNVGVSKTILKNAGKLTFNISDIFNTQSQRYAVQSFGVSSSNMVKAESQFARLVFTWKFGNKQVKAAKQRSTGIDDQKRRTESN